MVVILLCGGAMYTDFYFERQEIPAAFAARAMAVPPVTVRRWLTTGELAGRQTLTHRWRVRVGDCRALIRRCSEAGSVLEARFDSILRTRVLRMSTFRTGATRTNALSSK
jgi:hypothetical protein